MYIDPSFLTKSLQELENCDWGEPGVPWDLAVKCHRLRRIPLKDFTVGDLRIVIGQNMSLEFLVPLALDQLEIDPWVFGDYYDGDLLNNVLRVSGDFWIDHRELQTRMDRIVDNAINRPQVSETTDCLDYDEQVLLVLQKWNCKRQTEESHAALSALQALSQELKLDE